MTGKFGSRNDGLVSDDLIARTVFADTDDGTVLHGPASEVTHALSCSLNVEEFSLQARQHLADLHYWSKGRQGSYLIIHEFRDVDSDVASIPLCPSFLPKITCDFSHLVNHSLQIRPVIQNTHI